MPVLCSFIFELRKTNTIEQEQLNEYAQELNADAVYQINVEYDNSHLEIIVSDIGDINQRLVDIMYFSLKHKFHIMHYLYISPKHSLYIVVNERQEMFYEYK